MPDAEATRAALLHRAKSHWAGIADHVVEAVAPRLNAHKRDHLTDVLEQFESDLAPHLAPILEDAMSHPDFPEVLRPLFAELAAPQNLTSSLIVGIAVGAIVSPAIGSAFAPFVNELSDQAWSKFPSRELSPEESAIGVLKGVLTEAQGAAEALTSGVNGTRFGWMVEIGGNAIGISEALLLWRRGQITDAHLTEIIRYSNLNPKFYDDVRKLRYAPPGTGTVVTGALKGHLTDAEAKEKIGVAGTNPDEYDWLKASAGRPPGIMQMIGLWNRGLTTEAEVERAVRQSDINPSYLDAVKELRWYHVPPRSIVPMLRSGGITEARARELLTEHGVRAEDQDAFIAEAHKTPGTASRQLTQAQVLRMFELRILTRAEATARLTAIKLPADEVALLLEYADEQHRERYLNAALTHTRTLYVNHKITKPQATTALGDYGVTGTAANELFAVWDIERRTAAPNLTVAQWSGALRRGLVTHAAFDDAMAGYGYTPAESDIIAGLAFPAPAAPKAPTTKDLTVSQLVKLWQAGTITRATLIERLVAGGYSQAEANEIATLAEPPASAP